MEVLKVWVSKWRPDTLLAKTMLTGVVPISRRSHYFYFQFWWSFTIFEDQFFSNICIYSKGILCFSYLCLIKRYTFCVSIIGVSTGIILKFYEKCTTHDVWCTWGMANVHEKHLQIKTDQRSLWWNDDQSSIFFTDSQYQNSPFSCRKLRASDISAA